MPFEHYIYSGGKRLRCGYTTGSCAALAAKAACRMLLTGEAVFSVSIVTPKGLTVEVETREAFFQGERAICAVEKDAGDDPDSTNGVLVYAAVTRRKEPGVRLEGGKGVGRVTRRGLEQPVGEPAINRVPRQMIRQAVEEVSEELGYDGGFGVTISIPAGEELAKKTFNPRLGIEGGISVLGTSGIVEPMSTQALVDTIRLEAKVQAEVGAKSLIITPGNYGQAFLESYPHLTGCPSVKCSNYIGEALDIAAELGFEKVLVAGHIGKLVKVAGGIMNTHSRTADCRMELVALHAALAGAPTEELPRLLECITLDEVLERLEAIGLREPVLQSLLAEIQRHLEMRVGSGILVGAAVYSNQWGLLGITPQGKEIIGKIGETA
ncbi:cobalt-precorrin-5B (C(1))-methyltransferase CbiD [Oscillospiraceae bacterium MB08-C2-2]|nr:cobalt-precorrin-5B (C(1))-methyltransferase CbiD [Oscillospiraceae bacterium MB08-C2-2]